MRFELVSPERLLKSGDVDAVTLPGAEGDMTAMPGHAPVLTTLRPGVITVAEEGGESRLFIRGGFAEIAPEGLIILAEEAIALEELDAAKLDQEIQNAREDVDDATEDDARARAQERLDHLTQLQSAI